MLFIYIYNLIEQDIFVYIISSNMKKKYYKFLILALLSFNCYSQIIQNQWTWIKGSKIKNEKISEFGLVGLEDINNWPIGRSHASGIVDNNGNLLLFGGRIDGGSLNEMWSYNISTNSFTFKKGSLYKNTGGKSYSKGIGIEHYRNKPRPQMNTQNWKDNQGNMWVFGGGTNPTVYYNDLWKYNFATNNWTQINDGLQNPSGNYGTKGVASVDNIPPTTQGAVTWTDLNGNLWMFGGENPTSNNSNSSSTDGFYNSLWKYDTITGNWTWMSGSSLIDQSGTYNVLGAETPTNMPGARANSGGWVDSAGNLWLFGGYSHTGSSANRFNDIWKYNIATNLWTWVKGTSTSDENIVTTNTENSSNMPLSIAGRKGSYWKDTIGNFWYYDGSSNNRMWMYNPLTNSWTLKKESYAQNPVYGQMGVSNATNTLGRRTATTTWTAINGELYLYSGNYLSENLSQDLWKYNITTNQWTWVKGFNTVAAYQRIKLTGLDDDEVNPGYMQYYCAKWTDSQGNLWVYGIFGEGYDGSTGYNDLWKYDSSTNKWKWINGLYDYPHYPTNGQIGVESFQNNPRFRSDAMSWTDLEDNLWLFGGNANSGAKNDLWKYNKLTNMWVRILGSSTINEVGNYGQQGVSSATNIPGGRGGGTTWVDSQGDFWLFGGVGLSSNEYGRLNDLWKYNVASNQWTWIKGSNIQNQPEISAGIGIASSTNTPPSATFDDGQISWVENSGTFWLFVNGALWKFNNNNWTKIKASQTKSNGNMGIYNNSNSPGSRKKGATWIDSNGNLLLFGGKNVDTFYQDLWKFDIPANQWVWIGGRTGASYPYANYGVQNENSISNLPGGRYQTVSWKDNNNNLFLYGGEGLDETSEGYLSDVWTSNRNFNIIAGNIKLNTNNNDCNNATINVVNAKIILQSVTNLKTVFTNKLGNYSEITNNTTTTITPTLPYYTFNPVNQVANFSGFESTQNYNFCATAAGVFNDLEITIIPINQAFPGEDIKYKIVYKNKGTTTLNGSISFSYNDTIMDYISATLNPNSQSAGILNWNFTNLVPFETRAITLNFNLNSPMEVPAVNGGDIIEIVANINSNATDETINDNTFNLNQIVVNSFDPNDKTCLQGNVIGLDKVGEYVNYLIRFENTGTATARNIVIRDVIDESKFDISTLTPVDASHNYKLTISDSNKVEFIFENINLSYLQYSITTGYVVFKIKTKSNLISGDVFSNTASIYFDYNYPIITNNFETIVQNALGNNVFKTDNYSIYPNPVKDILNFKTEENVIKIEIFDISGRIISSKPVFENKIDLSELKTGNYILKAYNNHGIINSKIIKE